MIEILSSNQPTARIVHTCGHCRGQIAPGTQYQRTACADSGQAWTFKAHIHCDDLFNRYARFHALDEYDLVDWYDVLAWERESELDQ